MKNMAPRLMLRKKAYLMAVGEAEVLQPVGLGQAQPDSDGQAHQADQAADGERPPPRPSWSWPCCFQARYVEMRQSNLPQLLADGGRPWIGFGPLGVEVAPDVRGTSSMVALQELQGPTCHVPTGLPEEYPHEAACSGTPFVIVL